MPSDATGKEADMAEPAADAPRFELTGMTRRMQQAVEDQIAALTGSVTSCLGDSRADERKDAVQLVGVTAELLAAVARLRGEFRHDYRIVRDGAIAERGPKLKQGWNGEQSQLLNRAEYDALDEWEQADYNRWTDGLPPLWNKWPKKPDGKPVTWADVNELREEVRQIRDRDAATPLPPENRGSNERA
jgi:hypothetical protein